MKLMLVLFSALFMLSLLKGCGRQAEPKLPYARELQSALDSALQMTNVRGVSVAIVVPGYSPWLGVSGESYPGRPITPGMLFDMGSAGKFMMAALVLGLTPSCATGRVKAAGRCGRWAGAERRFVRHPWRQGAVVQAALGRKRDALWAWV